MSFFEQGKKHAQNERAQRLGPLAPPPAPKWRPAANPELQVRAREAVRQQRRCRKQRSRACAAVQGPACALCRKQFTSATQLEEHKLGKWHQMRLRGELPPAGGGGGRL